MRTSANINQSTEVWHPNIDSVCTEVASTCLDCQRLKYSGVKHLAQTLKVEVQYPGQLVAVDLLMVPRSYQGYIGILGAIDHYSTFTVIALIKNKSGLEVARALERHVLPAFAFKITSLLSDNGREFAAGVFEKVLERYNIKHIFTTAYHSQSNGAIERFNRTFLQLLRSQVSDMTTWSDECFYVMNVYNNTLHEERPRENFFYNGSTK